jgi:serine/threonine-protein kinase
LSELFNSLREALADRYALERELGRGGMATVFLAEDLKHRRKVAIKVLHAEIAAAIGPDRFLREIEIAARLQHPHILPLYDSGAAGSYLFYVMPFVEGESLRDRLQREKQLSQEDVLKITSEVASALGYAHARDIVHRDIKPENIMLSGGSAVVADFGIARAASAAEQQQLTQTGTVIGTPAYMSPEQGTGDPSIDGRSDQYSLACVVYEMLVGMPPFTGPNVQAVIARHTMDFVSPPSIVRDTIPETMEGALLRALAKVPADRFPTVIMFAEALSTPSTVTAAMRRRSTMQGQGIGATSVSGGGPRWNRRLLTWGLPALAVLAVAWFTRGLWLGRRAAAEVGAPESRRIAVLYFEDRSPDKSLGHLADGLTEALIHELSAVPTLQVISRNGVAPYRHITVGTDSIARALRVGTIVDGTLAQSGDSLALSVAMVDAASGDEIEATTLKVSRADPLVLQANLANQVAQFLRRRLGQEIQQIAARAETRNTQAWELVQQAKELSLDVNAMLATDDTASAARTLVQADSLLALAAAKDRKWTAPIIERGWLAWEQRNIAGFEKGPAAQWTARGIEFANQAMRLRPDDPEALHLRGTMRYIRWVLNLDPAPLTADQLLAGAERDLRAGSVASNPNRASALALLSHLLLRKSEPVDGKLAAMQAYEVDPYLTEAPSVLWRLFASSLDLEDAAEATKWCQEGYRRFPENSAFTECQISLHALRGQKPDVAKLWRLLDQNVALYPPAQREYRRRRGSLLVAMALANTIHKDSARAVALRARAGADVDPTRDLIYVEILLRNLLGDRDEAIQLLKLYLATNPQDRVTIARDSTWWWRELRDDPEFKQLIEAK